jgi:predicted anti-sigma-YlaC factor YlaD
MKILLCKQIRELLEDYFEETLFESKRQNVSAHLAECSSCQAEYQKIQKIAAALAAVPQQAPDYALVQAISARAAELQRERLAYRPKVWR